MQRRTDEHKAKVVGALLALIHTPGFPIRSMYWDGNSLSVCYVLTGSPERISWSEAEEITGIEWSAPSCLFRKTLRKGAKSAIIAQKRKEA